MKDWKSIVAIEIPFVILCLLVIWRIDLAITFQRILFAFAGGLLLVAIILFGVKMIRRNKSIR